MNRALLVQFAVMTPLALAAVLFFGLGWWVAGIIAALAEVAAFLWMRRIVAKPYTDAAMSAAKEDIARERDSNGGTLLQQIVGGLRRSDAGIGACGGGRLLHCRRGRVELNHSRLSGRGTMTKERAPIGWFLIALGGVIAISATAIVATSPPDQLLGRLQLPVGWYGPAMIIAGLATLITGIVVVAQSRRR